MAETFTYDLISFLRVLYLRRYFILKGTIAVSVLVAVITLIWPETWRAEGRILVSTPKFKQKLELIPEPFDVLTYQGIMNQDGLFLEVIQSLKWLRNATHELLESPEKLQRLQDNLAEKAERLNRFELIQNTNLKVLSELLPQGEQNEEDWTFLIHTLGHLSAEELETAYDFDLVELNDLSVFDLRKMMNTNVAVVKETNLETIYSRMIRVTGEFDTAAGAKMLTNAWIDLFLKRAEQIVRNKVEQEIRLKREQAADLEIALVSAESKLTAFQNTVHLDTLRAEAASKLVRLMGVMEIESLETQKKEFFNLDDEDEPFLKELREIIDTSTFRITPQYKQALIPKMLELEQEIAAVKNKLEEGSGLAAEIRKQYQDDLYKVQAELKAVNYQIQTVSTELKTLFEQIRDHETSVGTFHRQVQQKRGSLAAMRPLLEEADMLENRRGTAKYADVSAFRAIKPDKRVFPKRSLMTLVGGGVAFILFIALAFFMDIWKEVTRPEEQQTPETEQSS